jgi:putative endonuclease
VGFAVTPSEDSRAERGRRAEDAAADYLTQLGWRIVARNWRERRGELDIVARDGESMVIVEVRSRSSKRYGTAAESVDARKQARLAALGTSYVHRTGWPGPWRIDVIAYDADAAGTFQLEHYRNAVTG